MKAYLKASEGTLWPLSAKVTTVGRENCDLVFQYAGLDYKHCLIEFNEQDSCYIVQDLNTAQGTYVNDVRVQNAAVRLAPGDVIRFGVNSPPYELYVEDTALGMSSSSHVQHAWGMSTSSATPSYPPQPQNAGGLPYLHPSTCTTNVAWAPPPPQGPLPRPPLRSRPLSAGSQRSGGTEVRFQTFRGVGASPPPPGVRQGMMGGWTTGSMSARTAAGPIQQGVTTGAVDLVSVLQDKECRIKQLTEELTRLRSVEMELGKKDQAIQQLQHENADLQTRLQAEPAIIMGNDNNVSEQLLVLESEVASKKGEINSLREQLMRLRAEQSQVPVKVQEDLVERTKELFNVRNELERVKKDKNITSGLVSQMQRDMANKDSSISRLSREIEVLKKELRERDVQLSAANVKFAKMTHKANDAAASGKPTEERDARERELVSLRQRFKQAENKIQEQQDLISALREELDKVKTSVFAERDKHRELQGSLDSTKTQLLDIQRAERVVRVDLEQSQKRMERFRSRVIQVTYATPGIRAPDKEVSDDELIATLKKLIDERTESTVKMSELRQQVKTAESGAELMRDNAGKLHRKLAETLARLKEHGRLANDLRQEVALLQSLSVDEDNVWARNILLEHLEAELAWEMEIEAALEKCGINVKISQDSPAKHILSLFSKWEMALADKERLSAELEAMTGSHQEELKLRLDALQTEMDAKLKDSVEQTRLEGEEKLRACIEEVKAAEAELRENAVEAERAKVAALEATIEELRKTLIERESEDSERLTQASEAVSELEALRAQLSELQAQLAAVEEAKALLAEEVEGERQKKEEEYEASLASYKEQIKQHAVTICAMEERLNKVNKRNKDYGEEVATLKKTIQDLKAKPALPPKPKVLVQRPTEELQALEHMVSVLRGDNVELKRTVAEQEDVIRGLRRDMAGASARLSDVRGELSEAQKQELERNREAVKRSEAEALEMRQQMAKLSTIIDKQKTELKELQAELSKEKAMAAKWKKGLEEEMIRAKELQEALDLERSEQKKQLELLDHEGRITSELTALGAQCRGERHEQVIMRQRQALAELRQRVKTLEISKPPVPTQDQALQQVVVLKKELAEMRASQALAEDKVLSSSTALDRQIVRARGLASPGNVQADMERSAHRETMEALEASESSYLGLLRSLTDSLDVEEVGGMRPLAHIPRDERERLLQVRGQIAEQLAGRVEALKERILRKDELLQGYERDLAKLKQAQEIAEEKASQLDTLASDIRTRAEESQYLRESLNRTRDRLNQEKRLNTAIKQKKTFHLENERAHLEKSPSPSARSRCSSEEAKSLQKKRAQKEMMKRKNYEINTLKKDLCQTEQLLHEREHRLYNLEQAMGPERPIEVLE